MQKSLLASLLVLVVTACAVSPMGRRQFMMLPQAQVDQMGTQAFVNMKQKLPIDQSAQVNQYVDCVAGALTRQLGGDWEVTVFQDDSANAFALPGRKIGVNSGIFRVARNQDQLATVLAHELAHVLSQHSNERLSQEVAVQEGLNLIQAITNPSSQTGLTLMGLLGVGAQYGILMPYSRMQESEADLVGQELMAKAGFDPRQSTELWQNMERAGGGQPVEFLSTHPSHATRLGELEQHMPKALDLYERASREGTHPQCSSRS